MKTKVDTNHKGEENGKGYIYKDERFQYIFIIMKIDVEMVTALAEFKKLQPKASAEGENSEADSLCKTLDSDMETSAITNVCVWCESWGQSV